MKKRAFIALLSIVLFSLSAAGSAEKESIVIWHSAQGSNAAVFERICDNFNESVGKEKGIVIEAVYQGKANDVLSKVNAASGTSTLPDIAMMDATAALDMSHSPYLVTIDRIGADTSSILNNAILAYSSDKGLLAMPFNASALLFYYNKTLFDSLSLSVPVTLQELGEISSLLGEKDKDGKLLRSAFAGVPTTYEVSNFIGAQHGLSYMVDNENGHNGEAERVLFGEEGTYKAFLLEWKALFDEGWCDPLSSGVTDVFMAGGTASMLASSSNLEKILKGTEGSFEVGTAKVPVVNADADGGAVLSGGALFCFSDRKGVREVLEYLTSPSVQAEWAEGTGYVAVNTMAWSDPSYMAFLEENPAHRTALDALRDSRDGMVNVWLPSAYSIYYAFQKNIADVVKGKDIDEAVEEMVKTVEDAIRSYRAQN